MTARIRNVSENAKTDPALGEIATLVAERVAEYWEWLYPEVRDEIVIADHEWGGGGVHVVWEDGPYEWAIPMCGIFAGYAEHVDCLGEMEPADPLPSTVFVEPGFSFSLAVAQMWDD